MMGHWRNTSLRRWLGLCAAALLVTLTSITLASVNRGGESTGVLVGYSMQ
ncbi:MAG: hypothetical protein IPO97_08935 [Sphingomonadales bacterium]|nr:hypothetical protein [Sphingomonadales bacterium]